MTPRILQLVAVALAAVALAAGLWRLRTSGPAYQVEAHQKRLVRAISKRHWDIVGKLVADDYRDQWGHDRPTVVQRLKEVRAQFIFLTLKTPMLEVRLGEEGSAECLVSVEAEGNGMAGAAYILTRINALKKPFRVVWKGSGRHWRVVDVRQPELRLY